jgi:hypothetical protein
VTTQRNVCDSDNDSGQQPERIGRRSLMLGAATAAAGAGAAVGMLGTAQPAEAVSGGNFILGEANTASSPTSLVSSEGGLSVTTSSVAEAPPLTGAVSGNDETGPGSYGVVGVTQDGLGVYGVQNKVSGLLGSDKAGVVGDSASTFGVLGLSSGDDGVHAETSHEGSSGVAGIDTSTGGGVGVLASSSAGSALSVDGVATFSRSGSAKVAMGKDSVTVTGITLKDTSLVLATLQSYTKGVAVAAAVTDVGARSFTVYLTETVKTTTRVAWFVIG